MKMKSTIHLLAFLAATLSSCNGDDEEPKVVPSVVTTAASNVSATTATVGGNITNNGNDPITKSGVAFSSNIAVPTIADNKIESTSTQGAFQVTLSNLTSGTTYHFRAFATNSVGTSYGEVMDLTTGNLAPVAKDLSITGTLEVGKTVTAFYAYSDSEGDIENGTLFQWYMANDANGLGETAIDGATSKTFQIQESQNGKFLRFSVTPKSSSGTTTGAEVKSSYSTAVGAETVTFTYGGEQVTYGTLISATTQRKWLDRNLGASRIAQSINDYQAYGDLFQWGRLADGHQRVTRTGPVASTDITGVTGITSTVEPYETSDSDVPTTNKYIIYSNGIGFSGDWRTTPNNNLWQGVDGINNPCPTGWRIPTQEEWTAEGITDVSDGLAKLKLTYTSRRDLNTGNFFSDAVGFYWGSDPLVSDAGFDVSMFFRVTSSSIGYSNANRAAGYACRCIKN